MGTVKAVHAYRADLDRLSESLADVAPDRAQPDIHEKITTNAIYASARVQGDKKKQKKQGRLPICRRGTGRTLGSFIRKPGYLERAAVCQSDRVKGEKMIPTFVSQDKRRSTTYAVGCETENHRTQGLRGGKALHCVCKPGCGYIDGGRIGSYVEEAHIHTRGRNLGTQI